MKALQVRLRTYILTPYVHCDYEAFRTIYDNNDMKNEQLYYHHVFIKKISMKHEKSTVFNSNSHKDNKHLKEEYF